MSRVCESARSRQPAPRTRQTRRGNSTKGHAQKHQSLNGHCSFPDKQKLVKQDEGQPIAVVNLVDCRTLAQRTLLWQQRTQRAQGEVHPDGIVLLGPHCSHSEDRSRTRDDGQCQPGARSPLEVTSSVSCQRIPNRALDTLKQSIVWVQFL